MTIRNATPEFNEALITFVNTTQARLDAHYTREYTHVQAPQLTADPGSKNVRIVATGPGQRSVFCFVRIADGAILKAAGWKAPAKHVRGSIFVNAGQDAVGHYGAHYLR